MLLKMGMHVIGRAWAPQETSRAGILQLRPSGTQALFFARRYGGNSGRFRCRHARLHGLSLQANAAKPAGAAAEQAPHAGSKGNCYGCGIPLQTHDPELAGFVPLEKYQVKKAHRQLDQLLCKRCQDLSNGAMIPAVADFAILQPAAGSQQAQQQQQQQGQEEEGGELVQQATGFEGKRLLTPEQLRDSLKVVRSQRALVVLLVDVLDASGSLLGRVRDLVGNNPIVLIGTKADLLPDGTNEREVAEWLQAAASFKKINAVSVHLVSSKAGDGVSRAVASIRQERRGRDVYVIGAANVGKSAFIRALVREMSNFTSRQFDPQAVSRVKYLPVESAMPGTTLQLIPMEVFAAGGVLFDTPGLHLHHRMPHILSPAENKELHPRRKLRGYVAPALGDLLAGGEVGEGGDAQAGAEAAEAEAMAEAAAQEGRSAAGEGRGRRQWPGEQQQQQQPSQQPGEQQQPLASYSWGGLVRVDVLEGPPSLQLVFYGPPALRVTTQAGAWAGAQPGTQPGAEAAAAAGSEATTSAGDAARSSGSGSGSADLQSGGSSSSSEGASSSEDGAGSEGEQQAQQQAQQGQKQLFGEASVSARGGLRVAKRVSFSVGGGRGGASDWRLRQLGDVAVSGIPGWVSVLAAPGAAKGRQRIELEVLAPVGVEVFSRPSLPVTPPVL